MKIYLTEIANSLATSLLGATPGIQIEVKTQRLTINSERAVPLGLLVNELCTNAVKHAFPGGKGLVTISLRQVENEIELNVTDDGIGMAAEGQEEAPGRHGTDYVTMFVRQLGGVLVRTAVPGAGTTASIRFPFSRVADRS